MSAFDIFLGNTTKQHSRFGLYDDQTDNTIIVQQDGPRGVQDAQAMMCVGLASMPVESDRLGIVRIDSNLYILGGSSQTVEAGLDLAPGERLLFSTDAGGNLQASIKLGADGQLTANGGSDYVALASKVDALWSALYELFSIGWTPVAQDGGAALKTAFAIAFPPPGPASVASTTLKTT